MIHALQQKHRPAQCSAPGLLVLFVVLLIIPSVVSMAQSNPGHFSGTLFWSGSMQLRQQGGDLKLTYPQITSRLEVSYERGMPKYTVRLRADAQGTWGARQGFNTELDLAGSTRIREASVTTLNRAGEWILGRHQMLLPPGPNDYRRFGLLVGNTSNHVDGLSWYRPIGAWELEGAISMIHVLRSPATGQLEQGDMWTAFRAASLRGGPGWQLSYAPTLLLSDAVDSHGWSLPLRLDTKSHRLEGEIAQYNLTGTTLVPTGWYTAWIVRYEPLNARTTPLEAIEIASIPAYFLPHMGNFANRGGRLNWQPGERGLSTHFTTGIGQLDLAWRQVQQWGASDDPFRSDAWELTWSPPVLPDPLSSADLSLTQIGGAWQLAIRAGAGYRF